MGLIKSELTELRQELSRLRQQEVSAPPSAEPAIEEGPPVSSDMEAKGSPLEERTPDSGFFSEEDEDETIALTGDELNNILDTADFIDENLQSRAENADSNNNMDASMDPLPFDDEIGDMADLDMETELSDIEDLKDEENMELNAPRFSESDELPSEIDLAEENDELMELSSMEENLTELETEAAEKVLTKTPTLELKQELKDVLSYMDSLLENLPEEKIEEFAKSEHFSTYQKLFEELGL